MNPIVVIAPESTSYANVQQVAAELDIQDQISLHLTGLNNSLAIARQAEAEGASVIVARGWSANQIIEAGIRTPVSFIPISVQDMVMTLERALAQTASPHPRIGFTVFPQLRPDLEALSRLLPHVDLRVYPSFWTKESMHNVVLTALADNVDVLIGGETPLAIARKLGLKSQILTTGETAIRQALNMAKRICYARELEQTQTLKFQSAIEAIPQGVISLDATGSIKLLNPAARRILRLQTDMLDQPFGAVLTLPGLEQCLLFGKPIYDEIVPLGEQQLLLSAMPVFVNNVIKGAILTFHEAQKIAAQENKLQLHAKYQGVPALKTFDDIKGSSGLLVRALSRARRFAASDHTVLIDGETGTGKDLFAQAIHNASARSSGPFVAINCGALPQSLLESELFGYDKGAFTGASAKGKKGVFELADGGTLFLDEIAELNLHAQQRLLRVLESQYVLRIGGSHPIPINVRIIAATNADLWERVRARRFRADLYYRLCVLLLHLPPLREREGDIVVLARHFLNQTPLLRGMTLSADAAQVLKEHPWCGNVRELYYFIQRLCAACPDELTAEVLQAELLPGGDTTPSADSCASRRGSHFSAGDGVTDERERILQALEACHGRRSQAAQLLGMNRSTLFRKIKRLQL
ncbi:MAG TPA: sigma 54-interacting transcriptional regulator [Candidatus Avidesulfovibrio excrementigallinarum]|nr:sigma 54-interacting transcriptional regulator [Candidatus Avidesulfovibrio excrementigallinarum]